VSHRNARTTFHGRPLMVRRYQAGWAKAHIAEAMGISRKCVHTWIGVRFVDQSNRNLAYSVPRVSKPGSTDGPGRVALGQVILSVGLWACCSCWSAQLFLLVFRSGLSADGSGWRG
jgi:hypothetical protein